MYAFIQDVPIGEDIYERIKQRLGPEPPEGLVMHLVLRRADGKLRYVDVWKDKASCDAAFETRIHPAVFAALAESGFVPQGEPRREEVDAVHLWTGKP